MNATEKDNVFYCDCGFSWRRGMSGSHNCEDGLRAKLTDMAVQLANAESKCRELAAENEKRNTHSEALAVDNAALREVIERMVNQFAMSGISPEEKSINPAKSLMFDAKSALFMLATDAYLAEVRAQGVEMAIGHIEQTICPNHETILNEFADKIRKWAVL
ncbi:hypothetical protein DRK89_13025 [Salmonella enterica subsp. enterica]|nr:hypothetical protein [Salmonella enterica subsp. enterica serovar London]